MKIDYKTASIFILPILGIAVAWGESISRLDTMEEQLKEKVSKDELEGIKVEIIYIKEKADDNFTMLYDIWKKTK
tara:strand:+ start:30 stop:254 length:225 start_codon:yes stop_codon:yes gene_type:complete